MLNKLNITTLTLPFIGKDITASKVREVLVKLCLGYIDDIKIYYNYDSQKVFRSVNITFSEIFNHDQAKSIMKQLGEGGDVVIRMHKYKTSCWILRNSRIGSIYVLRPKKGQKRLFIDI